MMVKAAQARVGEGDPFHARKIATGRYFLERILPEAAGHLAKLKTGAESLMALEGDAF